MSNQNPLDQEAINLHHQGNFTAAEQKYQEILQQEPNNAEIWHNLGVLYYQNGRYAEALNISSKCLKLAPEIALYYYQLGLILEKIGSVTVVIRAYQQAIALNPQLIDAYINMGRVFLEAGNLFKVEWIYRQLIAQNIPRVELYKRMGKILRVRHQFNEAIEMYQKALQLTPNDPNLHHQLQAVVELKTKTEQLRILGKQGLELYQQKQYQETIKIYQELLNLHLDRLNTGEIKEIYQILYQCYLNLKKYQEISEICQKLTKLCTTTTELYQGYFSYIDALHKCGRTEDAIAIAKEAFQLLPNYPYFQRQQYLMLPILYDHPTQIDFYRQRFTQGLDKLIQEINLTTPEAKKQALLGINLETNFFLAYQGKNDLDLQTRYGEFWNKIVAANYPELTKPIPLPTIGTDEKIRVGYISMSTHRHTVGRLFLGWVHYHNRQKFEISCYHLSKTCDDITTAYQRCVDKFYPLPHPGIITEDYIINVTQKIISDRLHILVFLDVGMQPYMNIFSGFRLAPIQCVTWGHPITSGSPTMDYFLSSDLMEPEDGQQHYSEKLIRLPKIGISYPQPIIPPQTMFRRDFQLREDSVIYLSCQSLFKYLPQYDWVFVEIARQVTRSQFVFLAHERPHITQQFYQRLQSTFAQSNLDIREHCVILPRQELDVYFNLNLVADVFLDTFSWSGGMTTLEAIACHLPIVTCPGEFMRSRHAYGILTSLGVTETIAHNEVEYIEIAVKLALNPEWRKNIVQQMIQNHSSLYDDRTCITALESFYQSVVTN